MRSSLRPALAGGLRTAAELVLPVLLLVVLGRHLGRSGIAGLELYEAGDSAGDMLQARLGTRNLWFTTGHHTDVGASHPGPVALWVKALVEPLHRLGVGASVYSLTMVVFTGLRLLLLWAAARCLATSVRSAAAGAVFATAVAFTLTPEGGGPGLDLQGATIHYMAIWAVLLLVAGAVSVAVRPEHGLLTLTIGAGLTAHLHTPTFPLGVLGLLAAGLLMVTHRSRGPRHRSAAVAWAVFTAPLLARVVLEPGFPFNYLDAVRQRQSSAMSEAGRSAIEGVALISGITPGLILASTFAPLTAGVLLLILRRTWVLSALLTAVSAYSWAVLAASPRQERIATEVAWIAAMPMLAAGLLTFALYTLTGAILRRRSSRFGIRAHTFAGILLAVVLLPGFMQDAIPSQVSLSGGSDGRHVPVVAARILESAGGERFALVMPENRWFVTSSGVILELERSGADYCVAARANFLEMLQTFLHPDRLCSRTGAPLPAFVVDRAREPGTPPPEGMELIETFPAPTETLYGTPAALELLRMRCTPEEILPCREYTLTP